MKAPARLASKVAARLGVTGHFDDIFDIVRLQLLPKPNRESYDRFVAALHDRGPKVVLGHTVKAGGGIEDGERVLDIIAAHPATARHIAMELTRRFVSDDPP